MAGFGYTILGFGAGGGVSPQSFDYQFIAGGGSGNRNQHGGGGGGGGFRTNHLGGTQLELTGG